MKDLLVSISIAVVIYCLMIIGLYCYDYSQLLLPVQVVLLCMDFVLSECLHNTKLPVRYISCEVYESLGLNCLGVVSERSAFRTNRNDCLTLRLSRLNKLSLNRRDSRAVRFGLRRVLALLLQRTNN